MSAQTNINASFTWSSSPSPSPTELKRDDFRRINPKGSGRHYYFSYRDPYMNVEVCLEPCLNGFDVGLYEGENLVGSKRCTDFKSDVYKAETKETQLLDLHETQERSALVWDKAVSIANQLYRAFRNQKRIEKMGLAKPTPVDYEYPDYGKGYGTATQDSNQYTKEMAKPEWTTYSSSPGLPKTHESKSLPQNR